MSTITINGNETEMPAGAVAYKHADPIEDARWIYDNNEADEIYAEDPSLVVRPEPIKDRAFNPMKRPRMTADDLQQAEARYQRASRRAEEARAARNELVRRALAEGWTHARIAEATGHPRGWVSQQIR